jgi:hypothetical protein
MESKEPTMIDAIRTFLNDLKFAARSLAHTKGLTVTVIITLALGIGANAAIFSVVRASCCGRLPIVMKID